MPPWFLGKIKVPASVMESGSRQYARAVALLLTGLREHDIGVIVGAYQFFIERGEPGSESALIQALDAKGDSDMAVDFLNCGNSDLATAANQWASGHGYRITSRPGGPTVRWGNSR
jgi:hypothetical protein